MREQAFLEAGDEHRIELQALGRMDRHQLDRVLPGLCLVVARLQRGVREEGIQRRHHLATFGIGHAECRRAGLVDRQAHHVLAETLLGDECFGRVDQFIQVLQPVLALAVGLVELDEARGLQHVLDDLAQRLAERRRAHRVDRRDEGLQVGAALAGDRADALDQAAPARSRRILQLLDGARTDAAGREVDHPQEAGVVVRVLDQAQVGERVLDLGALEEAQATIDLVRNAGIEQRALEHPALRVAAVEQRDLVARRPFPVQRLGLLDEPLRLGVIGRRLVDAHRLARAGLRAQFLAQSFRVARDQLVGRVEDVAE